VDGRPSIVLAVEVQSEFFVQPFDDREEVLLCAEVDEGEGLVVQAVAQATALGGLERVQVVEYVGELDAGHDLVAGGLLEIFLLDFYLSLLLDFTCELFLVPLVMHVD